MADEPTDKKKKPAAKKAASEKKPAAEKKPPVKKEPKLPPLEDREITVEKADPRTIRLDGKTQFRVSHSNATVEDYAERMQAGDKFPPAKVVKDSEGNLWPHDGHHTILAAIKAGKVVIDIESIPGTRREAQYLALGANARNGLHRTRDDIRKAARAMLADPEWGKMSNRTIAKHISVSDPFIGKVRSEMQAEQESRDRQTGGGDGQNTIPGGVGEAGKVPDDKTAPAAGAGEGLSEEERARLNNAASEDNASELAEDHVNTGDGGGEDLGGDTEQPEGGGDHPLGAPAEAGTTLAPTPGAKPREDNRTSDQKIEDAKKWSAATDKICRVLGQNFVEALQSGRINLSEQDVIRYGELEDEELLKAAKSMMNNWPFVKHQRVVQGVVNGDSKLIDLVNRCIGEGGKFVMELNGCNIVAMMSEPE